MSQAKQPSASDDNRMRYRRIAPVYDLLELPFEYTRYRPLRRMLFAGLSGRILDAGVGTGRNIPFYPPDSEVTGIDTSPEMLARAKRRRARLGTKAELLERDVRATGFPDRSFDTVVATFLFCVLPEQHQLPALRELARVCKPGAELRLLEYTRPQATFRRLLTRAWEPWVNWAYGASYDRNVTRNMPAAGLELEDARFVVDELIQYVVARPRA
jgi:demethylmenaquinone methyltransferase/2-methoxy-6-polyprenyl-1,4-benzoquinol methylase